jgi:RNA polymerase sigma-70 factor (ECF subfamily)
MAQLSTESVWSHMSDDLRSFIRRRVGDDHAADDLLQDTFVRIHRSLPTLQDSERLTAWVYSIARNAIHDHYRRQTASEPIPTEGIAADDDPQRRFRSHASVWMQELIDQLPEPYRVAVTLSEIDGLTQQQVADRLGLSLSGAKSRVQRGRALLRDVLDHCCIFQRDHAGRLQGCDPLPNRTVCRDCGEE